jgi:DNA-binding MarR family transcriptional regulator
MDDEITLTFGQRVYRVRGIKGHWFKTMRVHIKATMAERCFIDVVDLYASKARDKFIKDCANRAKTDAERITKDVYSIIETIEQMNKKLLSELGEDKRELTRQEKEEAMDYLKSPDLLDLATQDMETMGYVGEELNKKIGFLIAVSRKLSKPLSGIIVSQSAAGKSFLIDTLERITPPEDLIFFSRITPQALFYMEKDFLKHKLVIIEEKHGSEPADYPIRSLQSKGKLVSAIPIKDNSTKSLKTVTVQVEGPIAYLETTTDGNINYENTTRCFELYLDESQEQTKRIHQAQRNFKTLEGLTKQTRIEALCVKHQNIQRLLNQVRVVNPYAKYLSFPPKFLRTRRDNLKFLNLIEAVTFLYQYQRPKKKYNNIEYIESAIEDYEISYELGKELFSHSLDELSQGSRGLLEYIRRMGGDKKFTFTRRQLIENAGLSYYQIRSHITQLAELGYIELLRNRMGEKIIYRYRPYSDGESPLKCLISPARLKRLAGPCGDTPQQG